MPKSVWSGNISRTLMILFFSFSQRPVLPVLILPLMAAALMFSAFWLIVGGNPFAKCDGGNGENQTELRQNQQQLFGAHAAGFDNGQLAAGSQLAEGNQAADQKRLAASVHMRAQASALKHTAPILRRYSCLFQDRRLR